MNKVTLEHYLNKRYIRINHGPGRRPTATYGRFDLRFRKAGKRVREWLEPGISLDVALEARRKKEQELNAAPAPKAAEPAATCGHSLIAI